MTLSRAKDSCQDLLAFAEESNEALQHDVKVTKKLVSTKHATCTLQRIYIIDIDPTNDENQKQQEQQSDPTSESISLWRPGLDIADYEEIVPLKTANPKKRNNCFPCLFVSWMADGCEYDDDYIEDGDDDDDDDDGLLEFDHQLHQKNESVGSAGSNRGVLKNTSIRVQAFLGVNVAKRLSFHPAFYKPRHSPPEKELFQSSAQQLPLPYFRVRFCSTKRVLRIQQPTIQERDSIWWQARDFKHFKESIVLLTRPEEEEEACAIWLANRSLSSSLSNQTAKESYDGTSSSTSSSDEEEEENQQIKIKSNKNKNAMTASEREQEVDQKYKQWWHKYGDSRRGLEKHACSEQAKQTLEGYSKAIQKVLDEQLEQRFLKKNDPEQIAKVYREYTAWSRDLALAAAASDADAVKCNFDDTKRKTREYFLLKQIYKNNRKIHKHLPGFMMPTGLKPRGYVDEHASNIISKNDKPSPKIAITA